MARSKVLTVKTADITRLEGVAQHLVDIDPAFRPKAEAVDYVAQQLGVHRRLVQEWVRLARPASLRQDTAAAFMGVYSHIAYLLSEHLHAQVFAMAKAGERDGLRAAQWLLPRVDPERFDPTLQDMHEDNTDDVFDTSGVPQEVFDRIANNDDHREQLAQLRQKIHDAMQDYETLIKTVQSELIAEELAERHAERAP